MPVVVRDPRRERKPFRARPPREEGRGVRLKVPWGVPGGLVGGGPPAPGAARRLRGEELRLDLAVDDDQVELVISQLPAPPSSR